MAENKNLQWLLPYLFSKQEAKAKAKKPTAVSAVGLPESPEETTATEGVAPSPEPGDTDFEGPVQAEPPRATIGGRDPNERFVEIPTEVIDELQKPQFPALPTEEYQQAQKTLDILQRKAAGEFDTTSGKAIAVAEELLPIIAGLVGAKSVASGIKGASTGRPFLSSMIPSSAAQFAAAIPQQQARQQAAQVIFKNRARSQKPGFGNTILPATNEAKLEELFNKLEEAKQKYPPKIYEKLFDAVTKKYKILSLVLPNPKRQRAILGNFSFNDLVGLPEYGELLQPQTFKDLEDKFSQITGEKPFSFSRKVPVVYTSDPSMSYLMQEKLPFKDIYREIALSRNLDNYKQFKRVVGHEFTHLLDPEIDMGRMTMKEAKERAEIMSPLYDEKELKDIDILTERNKKGVTYFMSKPEVRAFFLSPMKRYFATELKNIPATRQEIIDNIMEIKKTNLEKFQREMGHQFLIDIDDPVLGPKIKNFINYLLDKVIDTPEAQDEMIKLVKVDQQKEAG